MLTYAICYDTTTLLQNPSNLAAVFPMAQFLSRVMFPCESRPVMTTKSLITLCYMPHPKSDMVHHRLDYMSLLLKRNLIALLALALISPPLLHL
jgi:hypothetical protein